MKENSNDILDKECANAKISETSNFEEKFDDCAICLFAMCSPKELYTTNCDHIFHKKCFAHLILNDRKNDNYKSTCPICRQYLEKKDRGVIGKFLLMPVDRKIVLISSGTIWGIFNSFNSSITLSAFIYLTFNLVLKMDLTGRFF